MASRRDVKYTGAMPPRGMLSIAVATFGACGGGSAAVDAGADAPDDAMVDASPCALGALTLQVATLAGCADPGTSDGSRDDARFNNPVNVALSPGGTAYVADFDSSLLRKIDAAGFTATVIKRSDFRKPFGLAFTPDGYLYVETDDDDQGMHSTTTGTIWKVDPSSGDATVVARDVGRPRGLVVLPDGRIGLADYQHDVIELLDPTTGAVTVLAGTMDTPGHVNGLGTAAQFAQPYDLVLLGGDLIVADHDNNMLRRVSLAGQVSDFAGTGVPGHVDAAVGLAQFSSPKGLAIDAAGEVYVSEAGNHDIRKVAGGMVTTAAGSTVAGWQDDDNTQAAMFYGVEGLDVSRDGTRIVVADGNVGDGMPFNHVRVINR